MRLNTPFFVFFFKKNEKNGHFLTFFYAPRHFFKKSAVLKKMAKTTFFDVFRPLRIRSKKKKFDLVDFHKIEKILWGRVFEGFFDIFKSFKNIFKLLKIFLKLLKVLKFTRVFSLPFLIRAWRKPYIPLQYTFKRYMRGRRAKWPID